jgi:hypothetical protein
MTRPTRIALSLALGALALASLHKLDLLDPRPAFASAGRECSHTPQCDRAEVLHAAEWCLADSPGSTSGHCVRLSILP